MAKRAFFLAMPCTAAMLCGCSSPSINPVDWWHGMQGGKIAEKRPDPPGATDPYPNLSTVPERPTPPDRESMRRLTDSLVGDRTNAQYTAEAAPLTDPSSPSASPGLFGTGTLPPPPASGPPGGAASASFPAATAPPAPPSPRPAQEGSLPPPGVAPPGMAQSGAASVSVQGAALDELPAAGRARASRVPAAASGTLPPLPTAPPPRPGAAGAPPARLPVALPANPGSQPPGAVVLGFPPDSSSLSPTASDALKQFVARRGMAPIAVTGYGDAMSAEPGAQTAALTLALSRAQAVAAALQQAGVPASAVIVGAEASGRGASLRLIQ